MKKKPTTPASPRERILAVSGRLFYESGIRAIGIDTIIARSGVAKATFYSHFKSKDQLALEFLRQRDEKWRDWFETTVLRLAPRPQDRPLAIFDALAERFATPDFRGCAFINTMVEVADIKHPAHHASAEHKKKVRDLILKFLKDAGIKNAAALTTSIQLLMDGATVTAVREGAASPALAARKIAAAMLNPRN